MLILVFLALYFIVESIFEKKRPGFGHTTGIIVILGILASYVIHLVIEGQQTQALIMRDLQFDEAIFFDLILPLIIFPSGYNMRRKKFFRNIGTIMKFGFVGTIICFAIYTSLAYWFLEMGLLTVKD